MIEKQGKKSKGALSHKGALPNPKASKEHCGCSPHWLIFSSSSQSSDTQRDTGPTLCSVGIASTSLPFAGHNLGIRQSCQAFTASELWPGTCIRKTPF